MKEGFIKVGAVSPTLCVADVSSNTEACIAEAKRAAESGVKLLVFPELSLTGATCFDLFRHRTLTDAAINGLARFADATREFDLISVIGLPVRCDMGVLNVAAVIYRGEVVRFVAKTALSNEEMRYFNTPCAKCTKICTLGREIPMDKDAFTTLPGGIRALTVIGAPECVFVKEMNIKGASLVINLDASPETMYKKGGRCDTVRGISSALEIPYVLANAGEGESTTDAVYSGHSMIADGDIISESELFATDSLITADVKLGKAKVRKHSINKTDFVKKSSPRAPFIPADDKECLIALELQARALAARMKRSYSKNMVIGVSGGLDSTLALLVCARAADILGLDRSAVLGITMPCFGTTNRTRSNAEKLSIALGIGFRTVAITDSVIQHLKDIGHDGVTTDVTYENAQARERTQVLMDIANMIGGLVVGTGDLSELVLGWATYNGDHMSMYAVNASIPKTLVRRMVEVYSENARSEGAEDISDVLNDILATPVSPELLPPKDGEIAQCTESLVGPYELHDYFIYHTLKYGCGPREIYEMAKRDFKGVYENEVILGWLRVFSRRFFSQQFKRSCMPDGPKVTEISVSPRCDLRMPSDSSSGEWMRVLDEIEKEEA